MQVDGREGKNWEGGTLQMPEKRTTEEEAIVGKLETVRDGGQKGSSREAAGQQQQQEEDEEKAHREYTSSRDLDWIGLMDSKQMTGGDGKPSWVEQQIMD